MEESMPKVFNELKKITEKIRDALQRYARRRVYS